MYALYVYKNIYFIYKICLLIKFAPDPFSILTTFKDPDLPLPIPICRPWTSLGSTVFTQIVFSYNYERLIRSISTPFCLHNIYTHYLYLYFYATFTYPLFSSPLSLPSLLIRSIHTYIRTPLFLRLFSYSLFYYSLLLSPLYVHIIYTPFSQKIFPKKISTPKAYLKIFPKFLLIIITPPLYSSIGK